MFMLDSKENFDKLSNKTGLSVESAPKVCNATQKVIPEKEVQSNPWTSLNFATSSLDPEFTLSGA